MRSHVSRRAILTRMAGLGAIAATTSGLTTHAAGAGARSTPPTTVSQRGGPMSQASSSPTAGPLPAESGYVTINGLDLYYERYGGGDATPLLLLHGGLLTSGLAFGPMVPHLTGARPVLTVDLEGHGRTALLDRPLSFQQMADDVATLLRELGLRHVDLFGFSVGGAVAWQLTFRHPEVVRKLVVASAPITREGWAPEIVSAMAGLNPEAAAAMEATPLYQAYAAVAPKPEDWPELVTSVGQLNTGQPYDWSEEVADITTPTLYIVGDADSVLPEHTVELFRLLGGGVVGDLAPLPNAQLAVLPGTNHSAVLARTDLLVPIITGFLDAPMPETD